MFNGVPAQGERMIWTDCPEVSKGKRVSVPFTHCKKLKRCTLDDRSFLTYGATKDIWYPCLIFLTDAATRSDLTPPTKIKDTDGVRKNKI